MGEAGSRLVAGILFACFVSVPFFEPEVRAARGYRPELHLRSMVRDGPLSANSLFLDGYLNTKGNDRWRTLQMIGARRFYDQVRPFGRVHCFKAAKHSEVSLPSWSLSADGAAGMSP